MNQERRGPERRRYLRVLVEGISLEVVKVGFTGRMPVSAARPNPNIAIELLDLSGGGFRMITWAPLSKGDRLIVKLKVPAWSGMISARAVVKRLKEVKIGDRDCLEVGVEFSDLDDGDRIRLKELDTSS